MPRIEDEALLAAFRRKCFCESCGKFVLTGLDPHHVQCRGMGGGSRVDIRECLLSLCRQCHTDAHTGKLSRKLLIAIIAVRERKTPEQIRAAIDLALRGQEDHDKYAGGITDKVRRWKR